MHSCSESGGWGSMFPTFFFFKVCVRLCERVCARVCGPCVFMYAHGTRSSSALALPRSDCCLPCHIDLVILFPPTLGHYPSRSSSPCLFAAILPTLLPQSQNRPRLTTTTTTTLLSLDLPVATIFVRPGRSFGGLQRGGKSERSKAIRLVSEECACLCCVLDLDLGLVVDWRYFYPQAWFWGKKKPNNIRKLPYNVEVLLCSKSCCACCVYAFVFHDLLYRCLSGFCYRLASRLRGCQVTTSQARPSSLLLLPSVCLSLCLPRIARLRQFCWR